ncbi:MAG: sulfite exporter TauE/SafE family protein [Burkholderiales bacterium]
MEIAYAISGFVVGFIVGVTGVGGGSLMTPILVLGFGIHPATAVGTDLLYASITKSAGIWVHSKRGNVNWKIVGWLSAGSLPAALICVVLLRWMDIGSTRAAGVITVSLGVALLLTAVALLFKEPLSRWSGKGVKPESWRMRNVCGLTIATGAVMGVLVTLSSVGAGAIGVTALLLLFPLAASARIVGTDIAHAVPLTAVAGLGHLTMGSVDLALLGSLLVGSLPGIYLGSHVGSRLPERYLRPALATLLVVIGGKLVW